MAIDVTILPQVADGRLDYDGAAKRRAQLYSRAPQATYKPRPWERAGGRGAGAGANKEEDAGFGRGRGFEEDEDAYELGYDEGKQCCS